MMENKMKTSGTMTLSTPAAATIFEHEIKGQMSDGAWENSAPRDHWQFWCRLEIRVGDKDHVDTDDLWQCKKAGYGLGSLIEYVGDRMIAQGRMATAAGRLLTDKEADACEYMPPTLEEWLRCKSSGRWSYDFVSKYMDAITSDLAVAFYTTVYTERHMRKDLGHIRVAIKGVKVRHPGWAHHFKR